MRKEWKALWILLLVASARAATITSNSTQILTDSGGRLTRETTMTFQVTEADYDRPQHFSVRLADALVHNVTLLTHPPEYTYRASVVGYVNAWAKAIVREACVETSIQTFSVSTTRNTTGSFLLKRTPMQNHFPAHLQGTATHPPASTLALTLSLQARRTTCTLRAPMRCATSCCSSRRGSRRRAPTPSDTGTSSSSSCWPSSRAPASSWARRASG